MSDTALANALVADYSAAHSPCLKVQAGESFQMQSADRFAAYYAGAPLDMALVTSLVGPVHIAGVSAGNLVAVEIVDIAPASSYAYLMASGRFGLLGDQVENRTHRIAVGRDRVELGPGRHIPYRPMIGKLGFAPAEGAVESSQYGDFGGALSNIHIGPGATVVLRAHHDGGLLFLEDVHAGMGDGEATSSALEMAAIVTLKCTVVENADLTPPMILTRSEALTLGQASDLDEATRLAADAMLTLIRRRLDVDLTEAAMVMGAAGDLRIAFVGGSPKKVYAAIPRELLRL